MPKFIIVGAGAGGLFTARALAKAGIPASDITLLEKESRVGGKCHTFEDPHTIGLKAEYGATLVAHNYGVVLDAIFEKKIALEAPLPTKLNSLAFVQQFKEHRLAGKIKYLLTFAKELICYARLVRQYKQARDNNLPLPIEFELPFFEFAVLKGLNQLNELLRPLVTGFGYGAMQTCPAFAVIEYIGYTTLAGIFPALFGQGSFYAIHGGFQTLMTAIADDFHVIKNIQIIKIERSNHIHVDYTHEGHLLRITADYLILAVSPLQWSSLGITQLTDIEEQCQNRLTYYRYPVTVCKLKGYLAQQEFFEQGLQPDGFGKLALISTHDNRAMPDEGRLCTAYVNLKPGSTPYDLSPNSSDYCFLREQLAALPGVTGVEILASKIWEDYMSCLPWDLRCQLEAQQFAAHTRTGYVSSCLSFEDVACIATQATKLVSAHFSRHQNPIYDTSLGRELSRIKSLIFSTTLLPPISKNSH